MTFDPGANPTDGVRYLITEDIGDPAKRVGKTAAQDDEYASDTDRSADEEGYFFSARWRHAPASKNDIIQWDANSGEWDVVWDASDPDSTQAYVTNLNTGIQYKFNDGVWLKSYEGIYNAGKWTIVLDGDSADYDPGTDATTP